MADKIALITGVTGQDGAYLSRLLLDKGYVVHGIKRRSSSFNTARIDDLYIDPHEGKTRFFLHYGDLTDATNLIRVLQETQPDEIYNLAAQSHVQVSFETPEYTANADALGTLRLLEAIRILRMEERVRFYQASTSELYGKAQERPQRETTPFYPRSPYAAAKLYAYWITVNYREAYGIHASNGILFNHEGPTARRDLRHPQDYPRGGGDRAWSAGATLYRQSRCQARLGTCRRFRQRHVADAAAAGARRLCVGHRQIAFGARIHRACLRRGRPTHRLARGRVDEVGIDAATGKDLIRVDPRYFRPTEVDELVGDASKAAERLGWRDTTSFKELVAEMVQSDLEGGCLRRGARIAVIIRLHVAVPKHERPGAQRGDGPLA